MALEPHHQVVGDRRVERSRSTAGPRGWQVGPQPRHTGQGFPPLARPAHGPLLLPAVRHSQQGRHRLDLEAVRQLQPAVVVFGHHVRTETGQDGAHQRTRGALLLDDGDKTIRQDRARQLAHDKQA